MPKSEILKYNVILTDEGRACRSILITKEQEKLLLWLIERAYIDDSYVTFCEVTGLEDITDLT